MSGFEHSHAVNILLVEDNPGDVELTKAALRRCKLTNCLTVARDGEIALSILRREGEYRDAPHPDIILLDLNLPTITGAEVLAEIKQEPSLKRIPVVIMTSSKAEQDVVRSYNLHANCYVTKPVDLEQFRNVVQSIADFWFTMVRLPITESLETAAV